MIRYTGDQWPRNYAHHIKPDRTMWAILWNFHLNVVGGTLPVSGEASAIREPAIRMAIKINLRVRSLIVTGIIT
jgi:hypothetical protein